MAGGQMQGTYHVSGQGSIGDIHVGGDDSYKVCQDNSAAECDQVRQPERHKAALELHMT